MITNFEANRRLLPYLVEMYANTFAQPVPTTKELAKTRAGLEGN